MKFWLTIVTLALLQSVTAQAAERLPFQRSDVFELEWVSDPQISADGSRVVYVRNSMDIMSDSRNGRLWLINVDGSGNVPLTGRDVGERNPAWSPDGTRIAFTSDTDNGAEIFL
ncbi:MAG: S9 family peptidase, partial [Gammaproteobacteria bacterium]|nr:S9 family peptidase [Gammaproteobacteria bacterium]